MGAEGWGVGVWGKVEDRRACPRAAELKFGEALTCPPKKPASVNELLR